MTRKQLATSERRLASLVHNSTDIVTVVGHDLRIVWQATSIENVLGIDGSGLIGSPFLDLVHSGDHAVVQAYIDGVRQEGQKRDTLALRLRRHDGEWREFEAVIADRRHDPSVGGFVLNLREASERLQLEQELRTLAARREHDSLHDQLTGLPNRRGLFAKIHHIISDARGSGRRVALLLLDLDHFRELNDTLGHHAGDQLLREIGPRLRFAGGEMTVAARLGGDEFALVASLRGDNRTPTQLAEDLRAAVSRPFRIQGINVLVDASIGIAIGPDHGRDAETLLQRADVALYTAKTRRSGYAVYDPAGDRHSRDRLALLGDLPRALSSDELLLHYQPKFDLRTGSVSGVEALLRWQHPARGLLYPREFLYLAEPTALMRQLTLMVLETALTQCASWRQDGFNVPVAVNLSASDLVDASLPDEIAGLLRKTGVDASCLQLEIAERLIAIDAEVMIGVLDRLRDLGVTLSLDDFGTGSSTLSNIGHLPVQQLKIDRSFIASLRDGSPREVAVVRTIVALADTLGMRAVANGIESEAELAPLQAWGCSEGQGFHLAAPTTAARVTELVRSQRSAVGAVGVPRDGAA